MFDYLENFNNYNVLCLQFICKTSRFVAKILSKGYETCSRKASSSKNKQHEYILHDDLIKLRYEYRKKPQYICVKRNNLIDIKGTLHKIEQELAKKENKLVPHLWSYVLLNDCVDITSRFNSYFGPDGRHLQVSDLCIKYLLTPKERQEFQKIALFRRDGELFQIDECGYTFSKDVLFH